MSHRQLFHSAGCSTYVNMVLNVVGLVSLVVFFSVGGPSGVINDTSNVFFSLSLIPLALLLHRLQRTRFSGR